MFAGLASPSQWEGESDLGPIPVGGGGVTLRAGGGCVWVVCVWVVVGWLWRDAGRREGAR